MSQIKICIKRLSHEYVSFYHIEMNALYVEVEAEAELGREKGDIQFLINTLYITEYWKHRNES